MALHDPNLRALYDLKVRFMYWYSSRFLTSSRYSFNVIPI